jgi:hypothetical protein
MDIIDGTEACERVTEGRSPCWWSPDSLVSFT